MLVQKNYGCLFHARTHHLILSHMLLGFDSLRRSFDGRYRCHRMELMMKSSGKDQPLDKTGQMLDTVDSMLFV